MSTVTVPRKWDDNFKAFNDVIKESGLDLSRVKNKKVDKWVVLIPAQSTETQKSYGVVLVYKNEARGAYIPVSYTHLDVYKRQGQRAASFQTFLRTLRCAC